jgi:hypothetical protein
LPDLNGLSRQAYNALDERLRGIKRIMEDDNFVAMNRLKVIDKPVYNNRFMIGEQRSHAIAHNFHWLINKNQADRGDASGNQ